MNAAPLRYPVGAPGAQRLLLGALALLWMLGLGLWAASLGLGAPGWASAWTRLDTLPPPWWLSLCVGAGLLLWGRWQLRQPVRAELVWEPGAPGRRRSVPGGAAGQWRWFSPAWQRGLALAEVRCVLDAQHLLLLRWRSASGLSGWAWLQSATDAAQWRALRCALFAAPAPAPP